MKKINNQRMLRRKFRISKNIFGTKDKPRISVYRSNKFIYAQAIDDQERKTILASSSLKLKEDKLNKTDAAKLVGKKLAEALIAKGVTRGIFDRGQYTYNGRVKALAEGLREGKLVI
jgi:large subunit ribosomal protein L18